MLGYKTSKLFLCPFYQNDQDLFVKHPVKQCNVFFQQPASCTFHHVYKCLSYDRKNPLMFHWKCKLESKLDHGEAGYYP